MSAYIVEENVINFMIQAGMSRAITSCYGLSWWKKPTYEPNGTMKLTYANDQEVGQMLWNQNIRSVRVRYGVGDLPGPTANPDIPAEEQFIYKPRPWTMEVKPIQVIKACHCYAYQSCESDDWALTESYRFSEALINASVHSVAGYEDAEWGAPENPNTGAVSISRMIERGRR